MLVGGFVMLVLFLLNEGESHPSPMKRIGMDFILNGIGFVAKIPIMPLAPFRIRNVALCHGLALIIGFCMMSGLNYIPVYFQTIRGDSSTISGQEFFLTFPLLLHHFSITFLT